MPFPTTRGGDMSSRSLDGIFNTQKSIEAPARACESDDFELQGRHDKNKLLSFQWAPGRVGAGLGLRKRKAGLGLADPGPFLGPLGRTLQRSGLAVSAQPKVPNNGQGSGELWWPVALSGH
ncbi:hypothetical protein ACHAQJ_001481 [Trichoderma viride]